MQLEGSRNQNLNNIRNRLKQNPIFRINTQKVQDKQKSFKFKKTVHLKVGEQSIESKSVTFTEQQSHISRNLKNFQLKYQLLQKIGQGSNGMVKKCRQIKTQKIYAVKISAFEDQQIIVLKTIFKKVKELNSGNIIKYKELYLVPNKRICYLVMEYIQYPSLRKVKHLTQNELKSIIKQLLLAIQEMHRNQLCHRDIKLDNILFNRNQCIIVIIDFGISKQIYERGQKKEMWSPTGTIHYKAPQMLSGGGYNQTVDNWAVGVVLYELITGDSPFRCEYLSDEIQKILSLSYIFEKAIWNKYSKFTKDLVSRLLKQSKTRLSIQSALCAPWFLENTKQGDIEFSSSGITTMDYFQNQQAKLLRHATNQLQKKFYPFTRQHSLHVENNNKQYTQLMDYIKNLRQEQQDIITS